MSLQSKKRVLETEITRYMTLLSNLKKPDADYIDQIDYIRGMVQTANKDEIDETESLWRQLRPTDTYSVGYIETGKVPVDAIGKADITTSLLGTANKITELRRP